MKRHELEHIIRAASAVADTRDIVIVGSQAILGQVPMAPNELTVSMEADVFPRDSPANAIIIDGAIGELSIFHQTFGYYAHGVGEDTAVLPVGWRDRLVAVSNENTQGATGWCLEVYDLAVSKLVAGREKDVKFVRSMLHHGIVGLDELRSRVAMTKSLDHELRTSVEARIQKAISDAR